MELKSFQLGALSLVSLAFVSCSVDEDFRNIDPSESSAPAKSAIGFYVNTASSTRAASSFSNTLRPEHFKVTAFDGAANYYDNQSDLVTSPDNGFSWKPETKRYWPSGKRENWEGLTFYAYIDQTASAARRHDANSCFDMSGEVPAFKSYTVNTEVEKQTDLMYAVAKGVTSKTFRGDVSLNFRHALSQICFTARNDNPNLSDIEILSIELGGVKGRGTYLFPTASTGCRPAACGEWWLDAGAPESVYTLTDLNVSLGAPDETGRGQTVNISAPIYSEEPESAKISRTMYLIPQHAEGRINPSDTNGAYVKVKVRKTGTDGSIRTEERHIPLSADWREGKSYVYNISWDATRICFDLSVGDYR